jgi:twitching motility protein PilT
MCAPPSTNNILGDLAAAFAGREISDVQVRTGGLIYLHTNRGLEIAESFGIMDSEAVGTTGGGALHAPVGRDLDRG